jgi:hypothetical protein
VDELAAAPTQKMPGGQKEQADRLVAPGTDEMFSRDFAESTGQKNRAMPRCPDLKT